MMQDSKQKRALLIIIAILFIANTVTLIFLFKDKPQQKKESKGNRKTLMSSYLKNELQFSSTQLATFDSLHKKHMEGVETILSDMRLEKEKRFKYLVENQFSDSAIAIGAANIAAKQQSLEIKMLHHLKDVRNISTPQQMANFDSSFVKYMNREKVKTKKD